ncbi:MAG TPA: glycosyltransferase family 4 protein [Candidatus Saccharimonadales bacterium]
MKILMLGWELPPHNSGGLGVACYHLAKQLAQEGVSIDFVLPYKAEHSINFMRIHSATQVRPEVVQLPGAYDSACYACEDSEACEHIEPTTLRKQQVHYTKHVEKMVKKETPDVIHAHDWLTFEAGMRAKQLTGKPLIAHVHATEFDRSGEHHGNPLVHEIEYNGLMMADKIIAVSHITKELIVKEYDISADKIEVVHNSIDIGSLEPIDGANTYTYVEAMKNRGYKVVVSVGRLTVQKGLNYLLDAARRAIYIEPKLLFLIAGSGELRNELLLQSAQLGIAENILFTGFVRGKAWRDAYAIGDMFVMPSVSEPFGLVALEAAGYGNALLLSKQSGVAEVLVNKLTYDFWDTQKLADQIVAIAQHDALRHTLHQEATKEYATFSWQKATNTFLAIYENLKPAEALV